MLKEYIIRRLELVESENKFLLMKIKELENNLHFIESLIDDSHDRFYMMISEDYNEDDYNKLKKLWKILTANTFFCWGEVETK